MPFAGFDMQDAYNAGRSFGNFLRPLSVLRELGDARTAHGVLYSLLDRLVFGFAVVTLVPLWRLDRMLFWYTLPMALVGPLSGSFVSYTRFAAVLFPCHLVRRARCSGRERRRPFLWLTLAVWFARADGPADATRQLPLGGLTPLSGSASLRFARDSLRAACLEPTRPRPPPMPSQAPGRKSSMDAPHGPGVDGRTPRPSKFYTPSSGSTIKGDRLEVLRAGLMIIGGDDHPSLRCLLFSNRGDRHVYTQARSPDRLAPYSLRPQPGRSRRRATDRNHRRADHRRRRGSRFAMRR